MNHAAVIAIALILDAMFGEPRWIWSRIPHPAILMGKTVQWLDRRLNKPPNRRLRGIGAMLALVSMAAALGQVLSLLSPAPIPEIILAAVLLAHRSLVEHVQAVADGLGQSLAAGRDAVAAIVGRETRQMDEPAIARAAIESAAENFSDGVVAPTFWFLLLGLPGLLVYKVVNTADSMIGYFNPRYREFGWAAARLDDLLNWIPARLSAFLIATAHFRPAAWRVIRRDAPLHRSPNAGWPEAAMASSIDVALAGPRSYDGELHDFPWINPEGRRDIGAKEVERAARTLWRPWALLLVAMIFLAVV